MEGGEGRGGAEIGERVTLTWFTPRQPLVSSPGLKSKQTQVGVAVQSAAHAATVAAGLVKSRVPWGSEEQ